MKEQDDQPLGSGVQVAREVPVDRMVEVAEVAHDLNNVLNVMLIYSELIDRSADGRAPQRYVDEIREAAERGSELTGRLMKISRRSS